MKITLAILFSLLLCSPLISFADAEWVRVHKSMDDSGIIIRGNGQAYFIEKGIGCLSFRRYEGRDVLISSPGLFLGIGSKLVIPDLDQECRIRNSEPIFDLGSPASITSSPNADQLVSTTCEDGHWILSIKSNGELITLEDGSIWQVDSLDTIYTGIWLPITNITVCGNTMINTDDGERVGVSKIR